MKDEAGNKFKGSRKSFEGGYLSRGSIACNGSVLLFHSSHYMHVFDCATGVRKKKEHYNSTSLISTYCNRANLYFHMDAACYSWLKKFKISGFKPRDITLKEVKELPDLPPVLDTIKKNIIDQIAEEQKSHEDDPEPAYQNQAMNQLFRQDAQFEFFKPQFEERKRTTMSPDNIDDICTAIIFSKMAFEARTVQYKIFLLKEKRLEGDEMLPFIKHPFSNYFSRTYLVALRESIEEQVQKLIQGPMDFIKQSNVLNILHIYSANINSLLACRINLKEIFEEKELKAIHNMQSKCLDSLQLIPG